MAIKALDGVRELVEDLLGTDVESEPATRPDGVPSPRRRPDRRRVRPDDSRPDGRPESPPPGRPGAADNAYTSRWGPPLAVVVVGMFMSVLDTSIVNVAIPAMEKEYTVSAEDIAWVATAYTLALGVVVPTSAWLGERLGLRRLYVWCLVGFALFSGLCAIAGDLGPMIAFRILQAVPGGVIPVLCLAILTRIVPPAQLGAAMGMYGFGMVVAPGVGPALGGYLVEYVDWRWIFVINVPIGLLGAVAARFTLPELPGSRGKPFDTWGFVTVATGLFAVLLAVSKGQDWGWTSYPVLILLVFSGLLLALFVVVELEVEQPLLNVRVFTHFQFVNSLLLIGVLSTGLFASLYFVPVFLQVRQNITPLHTGLAILPQAVVMMLVMPLAGRLYDRYGARIPGAVGLAVAAGGLMLMSRFDADTRLGTVVLWTCVQAGGLAVGFMPIMTAALAALPSRLVDAGNSYSNLVQRVAGALGLSALTALTSSWGAQILAEYAALLPDDGMRQNPRIQQLAEGPAGLLPMYQRAQLLAQAHSYGTAFLVLGVITGGCALLAVQLPTGRPEVEDKPVAEMG